MTAKNISVSAQLPIQGPWFMDLMQKQHLNTERPITSVQAKCSKCSSQGQCHGTAEIVQPTGEFLMLSIDLLRKISFRQFLESTPQATSPKSHQHLLQPSEDENSSPFSLTKFSNLQLPGGAGSKPGNILNVCWDSSSTLYPT